MLMLPGVVLEEPQVAPSPVTRLEEALKTGSLVWQLSAPEDVEALLGKPVREEAIPEGGLELRIFRYSAGLTLVFARESGTESPFGLMNYRKGNERVSRRPDEPLVLRTAADLPRLRPFTGLQNVDASRLDLREEVARLQKMPFDTLTRWPSKGKLPEGFDPAAILAAGQNPGLGLRALHAQGKDGRGVDIAIIDQPLVANHAETEGRLHLAAELDVQGVPPQMHGPAVSSLAAGRTCGVAPGANLFYVAMPMWKSPEGNHHYIQALEQLLDLNRRKAAHIRAVSISYGGFASAPLSEEWKKLLVRAEREGVLVITCDLEATGLDYGLLRPVPGGDREKPEGYTSGSYGRTGLLVPGDGRAYASPIGPEAYSYAPRGGLSWGTPWLVGLAALGFQANPELTPVRVRTYLLKSATRMPYGNVADPKAFLAMCVADPEAPAK